MKILYLYAELMGYQIPVFKEYVVSYQAEVHVIHWDNKKLTPYVPPVLSGVNYYKRSEYNTSSLKELVININPDIVYVSGWMDKGYLFVCKCLMKNNTPIVAGCDTQWKGNLRQVLGSVYFRMFLKNCYSHIWVAGPYQYEYARKLGFKRNEIIFNTLSANTDIYNFKNRITDHVNANNFLYVGNFRKTKGTDVLIDAFKKYKNNNGSWGLICVGNGEMESFLREVDGITTYGFKTPEEIIEIAASSKVFILPSKFDQWGLVAHEFCALGMPLILSDKVGSSPYYLIDGFNGFTFKNSSSEDLYEKMVILSQLSELQLRKMSFNSTQLGFRITPKIAAASFISALNIKE